MSDFHVFENYWSENFATSLLVFALRRSQEFRSKFLEEVLRRSGNEPYETYRATEVERDRQISLPGSSGSLELEVRRPDICIEGWVDGQSFLVLVEAKIGAGWQANQLPAYLKWLTAQGRDVWKLVTLTRRRIRWQRATGKTGLVRPHSAHRSYGVEARAILI